MNKKRQKGKIKYLNEKSLAHTHNLKVPQIEEEDGSTLILRSP